MRVPSLEMPVPSLETPREARQDLRTETHSRCYRKTQGNHGQARQAQGKAALVRLKAERPPEWPRSRAPRRVRAVALTAAPGYVGESRQHKTDALCTGSTTVGRSEEPVMTFGVPQPESQAEGVGHEPI